MSVPDNIRALVYALHQLGGGEVTRGQAGIRINLSGLNVPTDAPWENCFSIDLSAEALARVVKAAEQAVQPTQAPLVAATEPRDWSAAAVAHTHSQVYADVQDLFEGIDPDSLLDDVFASPDADASLIAYEQLVTGEWDGEL
jgi:hypothetical protein